MRKRKEGPPEEMSVVLLKQVLKEMGMSIRNSSTKTQLMQKVKQARDSQLEANGNRGQFGTLSTTTSNGAFSDQSYVNKRYVQPCLYLLFHDPAEKRRVLFIILISIIYSFIQMFSEFLNQQFLSIIHQIFLSLYFLYYFVAEFVINIVLLIYKTILRQLIDMIFPAARISLVETAFATSSRVTHG